MHNLRRLTTHRFDSVKRIINQNKAFCTENKQSTNSRTTHFGFETVPEGEKVEKGNSC